MLIYSHFSRVGLYRFHLRAGLGFKYDFFRVGFGATSYLVLVSIYVFFKLLAYSN